MTFRANPCRRVKSCPHIDVKGGVTINFFEQELRKLADVCGGLSNPVFAGRACYGDLGGDNRVKLQFVTTGYADHYEAL